MEIIELRKVKEGVFRKKAILLDCLNIRKMINYPHCFKLAMRTCDGSFHTVNSMISDIVSGGIAKNEIKMAIQALAPIDPIHGQRYVIYEENPTGKAFLLGTVENAIMMLASG